MHTEGTQGQDQDESKNMRRCVVGAFLSGTAFRPVLIVIALGQLGKEEFSGNRGPRDVCCEGEASFEISRDAAKLRSGSDGVVKKNC